jgi:hypothetical protein
MLVLPYDGQSLGIVRTAAGLPDFRDWLKRLLDKLLDYDFDVLLVCDVFERSFGARFPCRGCVTEQQASDKRLLFLLEAGRPDQIKADTRNLPNERATAGRAGCRNRAQHVEQLD